MRKFSDNHSSASHHTSSFLATTERANKHSHAPIDNEHVWISNSTVSDKHVYNAKKNSLDAVVKKSLKQQFEASYPLNNEFVYFDNSERDFRKKEKRRAQIRYDKQINTLQYMAAEERFNRYPRADNSKMLGTMAKTVQRRPDVQQQQSPSLPEKPGQKPGQLVDYDFRRNRNNMPSTLMTDGSGFSLPEMTEKSRKKNRHVWNRAETVAMSKYSTHDNM